MSAIRDQRAGAQTAHPNRISIPSITMAKHGTAVLTAMTAKTDADRCNNAVSKCFMEAAENLESDWERTLFLECINVFEVALEHHGNIVSDETFASNLAQSDSRFLPEKQTVSADELNDHAAMQQADSHRKTVRATANAVHSMREEALAVSVEILNLEIESIQSQKVMIEPNEIKQVPEELRLAIEDMETAVEATKSSLGKYDALPSNIKELEGLLRQIQLGVNMGKSQTQDAIDAVTESLETNGDDEQQTSPEEIWADLLRKF